MSFEGEERGMNLITGVYLRDKKFPETIVKVVVEELNRIYFICISRRGIFERGKMVSLSSDLVRREYSIICPLVANKIMKEV